VRLKKIFEQEISSHLSYTMTENKRSITRLLFVDDEESVRLTLSAILSEHGFEVSTATSVTEALEAMKSQPFDVLLTDLNIGSPADGFILVTAMRRLQPSASTFILTGYPDFQTALEAIRQQVDDYFTKPTDIPKLVSTLKEKVRAPRRFIEVPGKRAAAVILGNTQEIIELWLKEVANEPGLSSIAISDNDRVDRLPLLLNDLANLLETGKTQLATESLNAAAVHGADRFKQGYTIPLLVTETRLLNRVISNVLQENLLIMNLSTLIPEALKIGEYLQGLLEESIRAFEQARIARIPQHRESAPKVKAKAH
jgi:ActR/RegA family two-component response regulator